jgi:hypothetical protein
LGCVRMHMLRNHVVSGYFVYAKSVPLIRDV